MDLQIKFNPNLKIKKTIVYDPVTNEELAKVTTNKKAILLKKLIKENKYIFGVN